MAPMAGISKRAFEAMRARSYYSHLLLNCPFPGLVNQSRPKRIPVLSKNKEALVFDLSIQSLQIYINKFWSNLVEYISTIYNIYLFDLA
jgi:hypothetical protein